MFAAELSVDLARLLLDLLIVLVVAKLAAEVAEHLRVPAVLGEIAVGTVGVVVPFANGSAAARRSRSA